MTPAEALTPEEALALALARRLHAGQVDKVGRPYHHHVEEVAAAVREAGGSEDQVVAAYLHDSIEDTEVTAGELRSAGVPAGAVEIVEILTHPEGEPREDYVRRVLADERAVLVKLCDLWSNLTPSRLMRVGSAERGKLLQKYAQDLGQIGRAASGDS